MIQCTTTVCLNELLAQIQFLFFYTILMLSENVAYVASRPRKERRGEGRGEEVNVI